MADLLAGRVPVSSTVRLIPPDGDQLFLPGGGERKDSGRPKPPPPFRRLSRRSGRIPAEPYPPLKCLYCSRNQNDHSGHKALNSGGLGAAPPIRKRNSSLRVRPLPERVRLPIDSATQPDLPKGGYLPLFIS